MIRSRLYLRLIALIGVIVPRRFRLDWRREWEAELRHREETLAEWDNLDRRTKLELCWHSLGAFFDALSFQPQRLEEEMAQDLRFGLRMLLKNRLFTTVAVLSLALGVGANTAIFSMINALLLKQLPVKEAGELVLFHIVRQQDPISSFSYPLYERIRDRNQSFSGVIAMSAAGRARMTLSQSGGAIESIDSQRVSGNFFSLLGVGATIGRLFDETDDVPTNPQAAAVISYDYWARRFGQDPSVLGRNIIVNDRALTIVGVAPPRFSGVFVGSRPEIWQPIKAFDDPSLKRGNTQWLQVMGRMRPGATRTQAQTEMETLFQLYLKEDFAARGADWSEPQKRFHFDRRLRLEPGGAGFSGLGRQFRIPLLILMAVTAIVLAIDCVNIANLLLARAAARRREIAVRLALGASRWRLTRQLLTESLLLAALGGGAGVIIAQFVVRFLLTYLPPGTRGALDLSLDWRVLGFALTVSILTGLLFGVAPARQATKLELTSSLKDQTGVGLNPSRLALHKLLVVTQVALSLFLLIGAGLFVRSLQNLRALDLGFDYEKVVQFSVDPGRAYNFAQTVDLHQRILARLEALPGVRSATLSSAGMLSGEASQNRLIIPGYSAQPGELVAGYMMLVGPRFFETMRMTLIEGREFQPEDERRRSTDAAKTSGPETEKSVQGVINQTLARQYFGDKSPLGRRFQMRGENLDIEVIGVVKDAKYNTLREQSPPTYYLSYFQQPFSAGATLRFRVAGDATAYGATIERLVKEIDPQVQALRVQTLGGVVDNAMLQERFTAQLSTGFSVFALCLACIGLYGVMSYSVTRRTNEIGVRMALGADSRAVVWLIMKDVMLLIALGLAIGLAGALASARLISAQLFGVGTADPATILLASLVLAAVASLAGYWPARRATRIDPMRALRCE